MFGDFLNKGKHGQLDFENIDDLLIYLGKVSHGDYRLFANNCEHFAILCKTGRTFSKQVREFFMDAIMVGLSAVAGNPKFAAMVIAMRFCSFG